MTPSSTKVVFATRQPLLVAGFRGVLRRAGLDTSPVVVPVSRLFQALQSNPGCLVLLDAACVPAAPVLMLMMQCAPHSRFVLCCRLVAPQSLRVALEAGLHGVLSIRLAADDAARALVRICRGERQFRFDPPSTIYVNAPVRPTEFDPQWMFTHQD